MSQLPEFTPFPKIARLNREVVVTEKIDGTNAAVVITEDGDVFAQSRSQLIIAPQDNHGFRKWVEGNRQALIDVLGPGVHFGEWWGAGIQRGYGLSEKRFSLFNVERWTNVTGLLYVVPVLWQGLFSTERVADEVAKLRTFGSRAAPGFMRPEGVVIWHSQGRFGMKVTLEKDEMPKALAA